MKVGVATGDWVEGAVLENGDQILGGSGWIRLGQYLPHSELDPIIGELAWQRDERIFGVRTWDGVEHFDCDIIVMQRWMNITIPWYIPEAQANGQIILNDLDDWYWGLNESNLAFFESHPKVNSDENIDHYKKTLVKSDGVIVSTQYLADRVSTFIPADRIHLLENHVEIDKFTPRVHTESEKPVIGWVGSTAHRDRDLSILKSAYKLAGDKFGYHHSGHVGWHPHFYDEVGMGKDDVTILLPVPPHKLGELFVFDIGVVPLNITPFNQAKSWIKGLEYAAAGIPFIASPSDEYKRLQGYYGIGRIAKNPKEWKKHLNALRDPDVRNAEAADNLEYLKPLDVKIGAKEWDDSVRSFV